MRLAKAIAFAGVLRCFDGFLYVGQRNREYLLQHGVSPSRLFFSPHCVDNEWFAKLAGEARAAATARQPGLRRVLFVGKLIDRKRPLDAVRAAALLHAAGSQVELVFAGSGELQEILRRAAADVGLPTQFFGFVNQSRMPAVYASADLVVLPSEGSETWGLAINEAMACGVPAVVSDAVGCGPDLVQEGVTGSVFPLGDVRAMADAMATVLAFDARASRSPIAARIEQYSPAHAAEGILEAADRLCRERLLN